VVTAWSTPGAALLATSLLGHSMGEAVAAFVFSAALITLAGITGWFERAMKHIPLSIAAAMLAGVLVKFGMNVFTAMQTQLGVALPMFLVYLVMKRVWPRYAVVAAGGFYLLLGLLGGSVGALFVAFPKALVMAVAGIALFGALASGLAIAMREESQREPALITFLVTASGVTLFGVGSAFWGLVAGIVAWVLLGARQTK
jgi:predicted benzoate:H+ symporter BenE